MFSVGFMLTYFTIKSWFVLAILSLAAHGLAFSFVYATAIGAAQRWFPQNKRGFVGSFVLSGYGFGKKPRSELSENLSAQVLYFGSLFRRPLSTPATCLLWRIPPVTAPGRTATDTSQTRRCWRGSLSCSFCSGPSSPCWG